MTQHGFARDSVFEWVERSPSSCRLSLHDSDTTRAIYPFAFRFDVIYAVEGNTLSITYDITNTGDEVLPAAMGAHPAFIYPLSENIPKNAHYLEFSDIETAPTRRLSGGLLMAKDFTNPVQGRKLLLDAALFAQDAVIMDKPNSRRVRYTAPNAPIVEMAWDENFPHLGIWSKDGADLLCIEPWHGMSSPEDFDGEITEKPNMMLIKPNGRRIGTYKISLLNKAVAE
jgi:galactose mutarotase-like enzyme